MKFSINSRVWIGKLDAYAIVIGTTGDGRMVVRWYDRQCEHFTAVVSDDECSYNQPTY